MTVPFRLSLSLLGWALNEEDNIADYIERAEEFLRTVTDDFELVLIDDGSTDHTWLIASHLQAMRPWLKLVKNERNRGVGFNYARAIQTASKQYFMVQTVDWAYDIAELGRSMQLLQQFDVLQGVRPGKVTWREIRQRSDSPTKALISLVNYTLIRALFRAPFSDFQNVTVCPTRLAQAIEIEGSSSFVNPEVMLKVYWQGASFKEIAVPFRKRARGTATGTRWRSILRSVRDIWTCWFRWIVMGRWRRRPGRVERLSEGRRPEAGQLTT